MNDTAYAGPANCFWCLDDYYLTGETGSRCASRLSATLSRHCPRNGK